MKKLPHTNALLKSVAEVQAGHPFRGSVPFVANGNAHALQMRDLNPSGEVHWDGLVRTQVDTNRPVQWLQPGDVVFAARGARYYAVCLNKVPLQAVCSPTFFLVRTTSPQLLPQFLAWQINSAPAQRYFGSTAEGSDQRSIRRPVLEALPLALPSTHQQQLIVSLAEAATREERLLQALIRNRHRQMEAVACALYSDDPESN